MNTVSNSCPFTDSLFNTVTPGLDTSISSSFLSLFV